jgi:hypothetical protein
MKRSRIIIIATVAALTLCGPLGAAAQTSEILRQKEDQQP